MLKQLEHAAKKGQWVEIYDDPADLDSFYAGEVIRASEDFTLLANVSPTGLYDGFSLITTECILQINTDTKYLQDIKKLYDAYQQNHKEIPINKKDLLGSLLNFSIEHTLVIAIAAFGEHIVRGFFKDIEKDVLVISALNYQGELDGETRIYLENITSIACDYDGAQALKTLYEMKQ